MPPSRPDPGGRRAWCIVASRFNALVVDRLSEGAVACLESHGVAAADLEIVRVAGAFEVPQAAGALARRGESRPRGIVALAVVVRGETPHFEFVSAACIDGLMDVALSTGVPVGLGVLTCDTVAQAIERAGGGSGNKGWEAAEAAWDLVRALEA